MSQQYPQQPHGQAPMQPMQPPKKKHTARNVILAILGVGVLMVGGCTALLVNGADEVSKSLDAEADKNAPIDVTVGQAFTRGKHETQAGWKVAKDPVLGGFTVTGKVKNTSDATSTSFIHFKFLSASGEVLGNVGCNSGDLEPGQVQALNCIPDGKFAKYAKITAEATF